jgi:hypothetical protein
MGVTGVSAAKLAQGNQITIGDSPYLGLYGHDFIIA